MKITTVNLPEPFIKALQLLQDVGLYPSRSEAIRVALRDFLQKELGFSKDQKEKSFNPESTVEERKKEITIEERKKEITVEERKKEISRLIRQLERNNLQVSPANY